MGKMVPRLDHSEKTPDISTKQLGYHNGGGRVHPFKSGIDIRVRVDPKTPGTVQY